MDRTIDFNDKPFPRAVEINDKSRNYLLTAKRIAGALRSAQVLPYQDLAICHIST
jgi:hypothetical protein